MIANCLELQEFDSEVFQVPFYRLKRFEEAQFFTDLENIKAEPRFIADAKVISSDLQWSRTLQKSGFRKVCMQVDLLSEPHEHHDQDIAIEDMVDYPGSIIDQHAQHFTCDRFSLDPAIRVEDKNRLYTRWISNSLHSQTIKIAQIGRNFCSFKVASNVVKIDLMSVIDKRRGIGRRLLRGVLAWSKRNGDLPVSVTTECENVAAWSLYASEGFQVSSYSCCFHLVHY